MRFIQKLIIARRELRSGGGSPAESRWSDFAPHWALGLAWLVCAMLGVSVADAADAGFLFDEFNLTLAPGHRTEAVGPFYYAEEQETQRIWAVPPLLSYTRDPETESKEFDFLYPLMTYDQYGEQYRWQFFQVLSLSGGPTQQESARDRVTIFPFYFQQRSSDSNQNYTAVFPFYGHMRNHFFRDEVSFVMWPLYSQTRKKDVVTDNYLVPFFSLRRGDGLRGWQFWPLIGNEHKDVTSQTNGFGDIKTIGGHDAFFALWPLFFNDRRGIGTPNPQRLHYSLPAYSVLRSPQRDATTVLWPFFNYVDDREKKYREWDAPWPLVVFARGEGKTTTRIWPFYSRAQNATAEKGFWLWPIYYYNNLLAPPLDRRRTRICFFLYSDLKERSLETKALRRRVDCLPFYSYHRDFNGNTRLQVFSLLEPFVPTSKSIRRDWSPLWAVWRAEKNPRTGATSQSLLWNLYRREATPSSKKCSLLFGLFQYQSSPEGKRTRLFYIPLGGTGVRAHGEEGPVPAKTE